MASDPRLSADGQWWWDGQRWVPARRPSAGGLSTRAVVSLIAGGVVLVLLTISVFVYVVYSRVDSDLKRFSSAPSTVPCDQLEHTAVHYHAALQILDGGRPIAIPTNVGRRNICYFWLHMHSGEPGIIHVEAPQDGVFTLGDFFRVWTVWGDTPEPLDTKHVGPVTLTSSEKLVVYVDIDDGRGAQPFSGDPNSIVLKDHEVITLEITPPAVTPPPAFAWPQGF